MDEAGDEFSAVLFPLNGGNIVDSRSQLDQTMDMEGPPNVSLRLVGPASAEEALSVTLEDAVKIQQIQDNQVAGEQQWLNLNSGTHFMKDQEFWNNLTNEAYVDINIIFKDGSMGMNRACLAVFSSALAGAAQGEPDSVYMPEICLDTFHDLILLLACQMREGGNAGLNHQGTPLQTEGGLADGNEIPEDVREVMHLLGFKLFLPGQHFKAALEATKNDLKPEVVKKEAEDLFAPGYSADSVSNLSVTKTKKNKRKMMRPSDLDDFIDDDQDESEEETSTRNPKRGPGRPIKVWTKEDILCAEVEVDDNEAPMQQDQNHTCEGFVPPPCHACRQEGFQSMSELVQHFSQVHDWSHALDHCVFCNAPFMAKSACSKHEKDKCQNVDHQCYKCGQKQQSKEKLLQHLVNVHRHGLLRKCPHCEKTFLTLSPHQMNRWPHSENCAARSSIANKRGRPSVDGLKTCSLCDGTYSDSWKHKRQCTATNRDIKYVCAQCKKGFRRLGTLKKHFSLVNKCKQNLANLAEFSSVISNLATAVKGKTVCADCGLVFNTRKGPLDHRKNCSAFTRFKCHACQRGINALDGFHIHFSKYPGCRQAKENREVVAELMARSVKPDFHVCHLCGAQYKAKESIDKHMLMHSENVTYFLCPEADCGKKFLTPKSLDVHLKTHSMPMVICSVCGKQVKQGSLSLHMVLHTGKKVTCPYCGKLFQHKGVLNKHIKSCHMEKRGRGENKKKKSKEKQQPILHDPLQTIQVELGDNVPGSENQVVKVNLPQLVDQDGRQVVGLMTQPVNQTMLEHPNQNIGVSGEQTALVIPSQYQRLNGLTVDIHQFIQITGSGQQHILQNNQQ